jgi:peptide deformylase
MAVLPIVKHPNDAILRKRSLKVIDFGAKFQKLVDDMVETVIAAPGVGLAAPQVASKERLIIVRLPDDEESRKEYGDQAGVLYVVANPKIVKTSKEMVEGVEACLSIPGWFGKVDRYESVTVTGQDRSGKEIRIKAKDWLARVFQHEIDHLEGRLFIDIAKEVWESKPEDAEAEAEAERKPRRFRIRRTTTE